MIDKYTGTTTKDEAENIVSWKDFRDSLDGNTEDFENINNRLDALERKFVEEAERLWETIVPILKKQAAEREIERIEKEQGDDVEG